MALVTWLSSAELYSALRVYLYADEEVTVVSLCTALFRQHREHRRDILGGVSLWIRLEIETFENLRHYYSVCAPLLPLKLLPQEKTIK